MSTENNNGPDLQSGQAQSAPGDVGAGQSEQTSQSQTQSEQAQSTQTQAEESFYADFNSLPAETQEALKPFYKQMQGAFTRKAQELSKQRQAHSQKVQAYDQFMANPIENIMRMGAQYGLQLTPAQAQQVAKQSQGVSPDWSPNAWEEVFDKSQEYILPKIDQHIQEKLSAYEQKIALLEQREAERNAARVEKQLNSIDPNWRIYEDEMRQTLEKHPSLANDIPTLYRISVPPDELEKKATQAALKKYDQKIQAAKVEGSGKSKQSGPAKVKFSTFEEAFQAAKQQTGR